MTVSSLFGQHKIVKSGSDSLMHVFCIKIGEQVQSMCFSQTESISGAIFMHIKKLLRVYILESKSNFYVCITQSRL